MLEKPILRGRAQPTQFLKANLDKSGSYSATNRCIRENREQLVEVFYEVTGMEARELEHRIDRLYSQDAS